MGPGSQKRNRMGRRLEFSLDCGTHQVMNHDGINGLPIFESLGLPWKLHYQRNVEFRPALQHLSHVRIQEWLVEPEIPQGVIRGYDQRGLRKLSRALQPGYEFPQQVIGDLEIVEIPSVRAEPGWMRNREVEEIEGRAGGPVGGTPQIANGAYVLPDGMHGA